MKIPSTRELRHKPAVQEAKQSIASHIRTIHPNRLSTADDMELAVMDQVTPDLVASILRERDLSNGIIQLRLKGIIPIDALELDEDELKKYEGAESVDGYFDFPTDVNRELLAKLPPQQRLAIAQLAFAQRYYGLLTDWTDRNKYGKGKQEKAMRRLEERMGKIQERYDALFDIVDPTASANSLLI